MSVKFVKADLSTEGIPMHPQDRCGFTLIALGLAQSKLNELLFKGTDGFVEENSFLNHLGNQGFQLFFHGRLPLS
jgi:hypothetical protein